MVTTATLQARVVGLHEERHCRSGDRPQYGCYRRIMDPPSPAESAVFCREPAGREADRVDARDDVDIGLVGAALRCKCHVKTIDRVSKHYPLLEQILPEHDVSAALPKMSLTILVKDACMATPRDKVLGCDQVLDHA